VENGVVTKVWHNSNARTKPPETADLSNQGHWITDVEKYDEWIKEKIEREAKEEKEYLELQEVLKKFEKVEVEVRDKKAEE
jgi:hypothetical protein